MLTDIGEAARVHPGRRSGPGASSRVRRVAVEAADHLVDAEGELVVAVAAAAGQQCAPEQAVGGVAGRAILVTRRICESSSAGQGPHSVQAVKHAPAGDVAVTGLTGPTESS